MKKNFKQLINNLQSNTQMKSIIKQSFAFLALFAAFNAGAQNTRSGYFVDDYTYRFQLNPAFGNSRGFVSMPALGNVNIGLNGNLHLDNILYNIDGKTTTFMNPGVNAAQFLNNISDVSKMRVNTKFDILTIGFKGFGGFNTININARADIGLNLPKSFFSLLKEGVANRTYSIEDLAARGTAYAEIALGHSRDINKEWRVGAAFKVLVGAGNVDAKLHNANLTLGTDAWTITSDAEINASLKGLTYDTDVNDNTNHRYVSGADIDGAGIGGYGIAFDLGAVYKPEALKDWTFSVALLDLGFINWSNNIVASTNGAKTFNSDAYTFNVDDTELNSFDNEWEKIKDNFSALYELEDMGDKGSRTTALAATLNIGAEYTFPLYRKLSFGLLNTTRINGAYSWTDFRLSANIAPVKCFDASVNLAAGTFGVGFGWLGNIHFPGFNLFLGMDHTLGKVAKQFAPLSSNASVNFGLNFPF